MYSRLSPYNTFSNVPGNMQIQDFFDYNIQKDWF